MSEEAKEPSEFRVLRKFPVVNIDNEQNKLKDKRCQKCDSPFSTTDPKQIFCVLCEGEQITAEDAKQILYAIDIAQGEIGEGFEELTAKLYRIYPEILEEHKQRESKEKYESERQQKLRKDIIEKCLCEINQEPYKGTVLAQIKEWFVNNYPEVRNHASDTICFAFDLWKYADEKLVAKIADECRLELLKGSDYEKDYAKKSDKEIVHGLIRILENVERNMRMNR